MTKRSGSLRSRRLHSLGRPASALVLCLLFFSLLAGSPAAQARKAVARGASSVASGASASRARTRHCGTIGISDEFHPRVRVSAMHIPCAKARRIIYAYLDGPEDEKELVGPDDYNGYIRLKRFPGWRCTSGAGAGGCSKGRREAGWDWFFN